jgi:hypothetical protein
VEGVRIKISVEGLMPFEEREGMTLEEERDSPLIVQRSLEQLCQMIRDLGSWNPGIELAHEAGSLSATILCESNGDAHQAIEWLSDGPWQAKNTFGNHVPK